MNKKFLSAILFGALAVASTGSFVSCKDYDDDIDNLQSQITNMGQLKNDISNVQSALESKIAAANSAAEAAQKAADAAKAAAGDAETAGAAEAAEKAAKAYADAAVATAKAEVLESANAKLAEVVAGAITEEQVNAAIAEAIASIEVVDVDAAIAEAISGLKAELNIDSKLEQMSKDIAALKLQNDALKAYAKSADVTAEIKKAIEGVEAKIAAAINEKTISAAVKKEITSEVSKINSALAIISDRLTSLIFAPTTYINGIEAINFNSLRYNDWGNSPKNWLRDATNAFQYDANNQLIPGEQNNNNTSVYNPGDNKWYKKVATVVLGDEKTTAEYYASPVGVTKSSVKDVNFLFNTAKNTRAAGPISIVNWDLNPATGKLVVTLTKNTNDLLNNAIYATPATEKFYVAALQTTLDESVLTDEEKKAGADVKVTSDWVRINETAITPRIHDPKVTKKLPNGQIVIDCSVDTDTKDSHYWSFNEVYNTTAAVGGALTTDEIKKGMTMLDRVYTDIDANKFIGVSATYTEDLDLLKHVKVCDDNGNEIDYKAYGLEFKFSIMPYVVKNQNATLDNTDQKMFAVINGSILTPIARNDASKKYNADAVGRTPVIQAVLCDTKNNAVADVRYFKVQWIDKAAVTRVWSPDALLNPVSYKCAGLYQQYILEKYMNDLYAGIVENGLTKSQFHDTYNKVYTSAVNNYQFFAYSYTEKLWTPDQKTITYTKDQVLELLKTGNSTELEKLGIGYVQDVIDNSAATQTHNFLISLIPGGKEAQTWNSTNSITVNNPYYEGDYKFEGFFAFQSATEYVVIPVVFDIRLGLTDYKYGYLASQWQGELSKENKNKVRPINPTLISDATVGTAGGYATTQLIGDITYGYMANGVTPLDYNSLLVYYNYNDTKKETPLAIGSDLIFDESRFAEVLPSVADLNVYHPTTKALVEEAQWHTEDATKTLFYARYTKNPANGNYEVLVPGSKVYAAKISTAASAAPVAGPKYVYLVDDQTIQTADPATAGAPTAAPTDAALRLVGKSVPVKVQRVNCATPDVFDSYLVKFIKPLEISEATSNVTLSDVMNYGSDKKISVSSQMTVREAFGSKTPISLNGSVNYTYWKITDFTAWNAANPGLGYEYFKDQIVGTVKSSTPVPPSTALIAWYEIENIAITPASIYINISKNGNVLPNTKDPKGAGYSKMSEIKNASTGKQLYDLKLFMDDDCTIEYVPGTHDAAAIKKVQYHNNSGQAITESIYFKVPVTLNSKWQKGDEYYITVQVTPNI